MSKLCPTNSFRQQVEQFRVGRGVLAVVQVQGVNQPAAEQQEPDAVGGVPREVGVRFGGEAFGHFLERTELQHAGVAGLLVRRFAELHPLRERGDVDHHRAGQRGERRHLDLREHRRERRLLGRRLLADDELRRVREVRVLEERVQPLEVLLLVVGDEQVIVALAALEVLAEEQPADVAREARSSRPGSGRSSPVSSQARTPRPVARSPSGRREAPSSPSRPTACSARTTPSRTSSSRRCRRGAP